MVPQKTIVYLLFFLILAAGHMLLDGWLLPAVWCITGVVLGLGRLEKHRFFFLIIFAMDIVIGLAFWLLWWNRQGQLDALSRNSSLSSWEWAGLTIAINSITLLLCTNSFYRMTRLVIRPAHCPVAVNE